jgi:hypothetical protein
LIRKAGEDVATSIICSHTCDLFDDQIAGRVSFPPVVLSFSTCTEVIWHVSTETAVVCFQKVYRTVGTAKKRLPRSSNMGNGESSEYKSAEQMLRNASKISKISRSSTEGSTSPGVLVEPPRTPRAELSDNITCGKGAGRDKWWERKSERGIGKEKDCVGGIKHNQSLENQKGRSFAWRAGSWNCDQGPMGEFFCSESACMQGVEAENFVCRRGRTGAGQGIIHKPFKAPYTPPKSKQKSDNTSGKQTQDMEAEQRTRRGLPTHEFVKVDSMTRSSSDRPPAGPKQMHNVYFQEQAAALQSESSVERIPILGRNLPPETYQHESEHLGELHHDATVAAEHAKVAALNGLQTNRRDKAAGNMPVILAVVAVNSAEVQQKCRTEKSTSSSRETIPTSRQNQTHDPMKADGTRAEPPLSVPVVWFGINRVP